MVKKVSVKEHVRVIPKGKKSVLVVPVKAHKRKPPAK
jgi:hypothetical protein